MRVRVRFSKLGKIRWTSHRDVARMWERAFRREQLPLAYSAGFSPRPKVSFGLALSTGHESVAEYLDLELLDGSVPLDVASLPARLSAALPAGVDVSRACEIEPGAPSLQEEVTSCTWRIEALEADGCRPVPPEEMRDRTSILLGASTAMVTRRRKGVEVTDDIRAGITDLRVMDADGEVPSAGVWLEAELATRPRGLRPSELLGALGPDLVEGNVRRLHQWISRDGARWEPLGLDLTTAATGAPHAWRAS